MSFEAALAATHSWFLDHGWKIILIILVASLIRRFGMVFLSRIVHRSIENSERFENSRDRQLRGDTLTSLFGSVIKVITWVTVVALVLSELGVFSYFAPLLGSAVALSLILGFGIQAFIKDFISGIFIVADNQYRVGDYVAIHMSVGGTVEGAVIRITLRTTVLRDHDGAIHFIPNGNIARAANQTLDYAKVNVEISLPMEADFEKVEKEVNALGLAMSKQDIWHRSLLQAPYFHGVQTITDEKATIEVRAKTVPTEQWRVSSELQRRLAKLISEHKQFAPAKKSKKS